MTHATPPDPLEPSDVATLPPSAERAAHPTSLPARLAKPLIIIALLAAGGYFAWRDPAAVVNLARTIGGFKARPHGVEIPPPPPPPLPPPWNGVLKLTPEAMSSLGIVTSEAKPQTEPIRLELLGTTEYISDTLTKVRPLFKGRVDKVHVTVGQSVKKGEPLIDLYSTELAQAKSAYEIEHIQWLYDKKLLETREQLLKTNTVSQQLYEETKNNEMKNRREYEVARDKLLVYGLTEDEVNAVERELGSQKARLTLRAPTAGLVVTRDVAVGNLYDENDTLLVIAPLERLWVWGNVFESDLDLVKLGQAWEIQFPFLGYVARGNVEYISNRVDPVSHAVRVRTSIPNPEGNLKSDMLVRGSLEVPPLAGRLTIPRTALVVTERGSFVFVEEQPGQFTRRTVTVAHEKSDHALIDSGVKPTERVASVGALILAQMYEDAQTVATGAAAAP